MAAYDGRDANGAPATGLHLRRQIGPWQASSVVVGMVVGSGIFRSASFVSAALGSSAAIYAAWLIGGLVAVIGAFIYAELSSAFPHPGGDYRFLKEAYGGTVAYLFAWSRFAVIFTASAAMLAFVAIDYLAALVPLGRPARAVVAAAMIVALAAFNLRGLKTSIRGEVALVAVNVLALLAIGGAAMLFAQGGRSSLDASVPVPDMVHGFGVAMVYVMLAYGGFNDAATLSAEVRRPRDMTIAMIGGMALVTVLYMLVNWSYLRALGPAGLAANDAPAAAVMLAVFGRAGQTAMVATVVVAAIAPLNALLIVGGRTLSAAAADLPGLDRLAHWDEARGVPREAILLQSAITLLLIAWGALTPRGFATMVDYMSPVYWLFLALSAGALPLLRRTRPDRPRPYRVPFATPFAILFGGVALAILWSSMRHVGVAGSITSFGVLIVGLAVRAIVRRIAATRRTTPPAS